MSQHFELLSAENNLGAVVWEDIVDLTSSFVFSFELKVR